MEAVMSQNKLPDDVQPIKQTKTILLTQGYEAIVDEEDFAGLNRYRWKILKSGSKRYAARSRKWPGGKYTTILMHREILCVEKDECIDHRNGNGLDNRRENLRAATYSQNLANRRTKFGTSRFKGVHWNIQRQIWHAQIGCGQTEDGRQKVVFLGFYENEEDAALAYDRMAVEIHGEFAVPNLPDVDDGREIHRVRRSRVTPKGEASPVAKLTQVQAIEIKQRALAGEAHERIAIDFGVSTQLVSAIKTGVAWRHL
jgi:hypothetical protein